MAVGTPTRHLLQGTDADGAVLEYGVSEGETTVGRGDDAGLTIPDPRVSRNHAVLTVRGDSLAVRDMGSTNGTFVNGERITESELRPGDQISFGGLALHLVPQHSQQETQIAASAEGGTVVVNVITTRDPEATRVLTPVAAPAPAPNVRGLIPDELLRAPVISEADLIANGVEVQVVPCASLGGGMGSLMWVDMLRNSGVPADAIAVVSNEQHAYARYQRLCINSQIPAHERLRSNSDSCPDNVWGFPGYATREIWREIKRGNLGLARTLLWQIFGEPALVQTYTPRSGDVFSSIDREEARIGWPQMVRFGRARAIRKTKEGRLLIVASASDDRQRRHYAVSAQFLHMAIGYPAIQLLPDLAEYREKHNDRTRVINAYEEHDHVYRHLREKGGTVVLRGRGIVASRIIQKLWEERKNNPKIHVVHLHRSRLTEGHRYKRSRRKVKTEFEFQPFNWPKATWSGTLRRTLEAASPEERKALLSVWGGTTTADRRDWQRMTDDGLREGWYRPEYGAVRDMTPTADGRVVSHISNTLAGGGVLELVADFIIDCTGLIASPDRSPLIDDLIKTYGLPKNALGRIQVTNNFEIEGMRHGSAHMYTVGAITLGGPYAAVDSFLGLQYASFRAVRAMHQITPGHIRNLNGMYSFRQWLKWRRGTAP